MKLEEKGNIIPPILSNFPQIVSKEKPAMGWNYFGNALGNMEQK